MARRQSLASPIDLTGIAVHSGKDVHIRLCPQASGQGIVFVRTDLESDLEGHFLARYDHVVDTRLCTTLGNQEGERLSTIEHLMAAFALCGVDDVLIEINGAEVPVMDGSAKLFVEAIEQAGLADHRENRKYIRVLKSVKVEEGDSWAQFLPSDGFEMDVRIDFPNQVIGQQRFRAKGGFRAKGDSGCALIEGWDRLATARTFGFLDDLDGLRALGLAQGASLDNTIAIKKDEEDQNQGKILNAQGLRFADEFVHHKALDAVGDLALAGGPLIARFESYKGGHGLNNLLLRALFADETCYTIEYGL